MHTVNDINVLSQLCNRGVARDVASNVICSMMLSCRYQIERYDMISSKWMIKVSGNRAHNLKQF